MKPRFLRAHSLRALCLLLVLCLLLSGCSKDGDSVAKANVSDNEQYPATLQELTDRLGNETVARAVVALYNQPSTGFSLNLTQDFDASEYNLNNYLIFDEQKGELQYGPFAMRDTYRYHNNFSSSVYSGEDCLAAFGTGEMSCLYYEGTRGREYDLTREPISSSGLYLRDPGEHFYGSMFPGGDFCNNFAFRPSSELGGSNPLAMQLHGVLTAILNGGTNYTESSRGEINGRAAVCYTGRYNGMTLAWLTGVLYCPIDAYGEGSFPTIEHGVEVRFWIDAATGFPLRVESDFTDLQKDLWYTNSIREKIIREISGMPGNIRSYEELRQAADQLLQIREISFRLELEPRSERIRLPELPEESERLILTGDWELMNREYAVLKEVTGYETVLSCTGEEYSPYLRGTFQEAAASGEAVKVIAAEKSPKADTPLYLAIRMDENTVLLREAGEPVCRSGKVTVASNINHKISYYGDPMPQAFADAVEDAIKKHTKEDIADFDYEGVTYHAERVNKVQWDVTCSGVAYVAGNPGAGFEAALLEAEDSGSSVFTWNGRTFACGPKVDGVCGWYEADGAGSVVLAATRLTLLPADPAANGSDLLQQAVLAAAEGSAGFEVQDAAFTLEALEEGWRVLDASGAECGRLLPWRASYAETGGTVPLDIALVLIDGVKELQRSGTDELELEMRIPDFAEPDPNNPDRPVIESSALQITKRIHSSTMNGKTVEQIYYHVSADQYVFLNLVERPAH